MKKLIAIFCSLVLLILLCGCKNKPRIDVVNTIWNDDNTRIPIGDKYILNASHPYDKINTDSGIDIVIHFDEKQGETR